MGGRQARNHRASGAVFVADRRNDRVIRRISAISLALALVCLSWIVLAEPASAANQTFYFTGGEQTFTVPAGIKSIHVVAIGAKGGKGSDSGSSIGGSGGLGGRLEADLAVSPGQLLFVEVGGPGSNAPLTAGGFNGGGDSVIFFSLAGGGGGGATDLRSCSVLAMSCSGASDSLSSRLIVAGGGGGGGALGQLTTGTGGGGGNAGQDGQAGAGSPTMAGEGGNAGTQAGGGAGGLGHSGGSNGTPGSFGKGGNGTATSGAEPGGGGGGGYFGGGGGGTGNGAGGGGGGGGSSFASTAASNVSIATDSSGIPRVEISPSNSFYLGKVKRTKHKGTATLTVDVPGPGTLVLTGKGLVKQRPGGAPRAVRVAAKTVSAGGKVKLKVRAKGKKKRKLNRTGKVKVKAKVTYTPIGADPNSKVKRIKLIKRL